MADCQGRAHIGGQGAAQEEDRDAEAEQEGEREPGEGQDGQQLPPAPPEHHVATEVDHSKGASQGKLS